jgi:hypothetical protein
MKQARMEEKFCRCIVHRDIVYRTSGRVVATKARLRLNRILPLSEDICDPCHKKILKKQMEERK